MLGRGLLLGLGVVILVKIFPSLENENLFSLCSDLIGLVIIYPLARRLGFGFGRAREYLAGLGAEVKRSAGYFLLMAGALFVGYHFYLVLLAPWDQPWTNKLLFWLAGTNNPILSDSRIASLINNPLWLPVYFLSICVFPPIIEEFLFRRWLYVAMRKRLPVGWAIAFNAALFGLMHAADFMMTAIPGFFFCWAYEKTQRLEVPILMHAFINTAGIALMFGDRFGF